MNKYHFPNPGGSKSTAEFRSVFNIGTYLSVFMLLLLQVIENSSVIILSYFTTSWNYRYC